MESNTLGLSTGDMAIVRAESVTPSQTLAYDVAKPAAKQLWLYEKRMQLLDQTAKAALAGKLTPAQEKIVKSAALSPALILLRNGQVVANTKEAAGRLGQFISIMQKTNGLPMQTADQLFEGEPQKVALAHIPYLDEKLGRPMLAIVMGQVKQVLPLDMSQLSANKEAYAQAVKQAFSSDLLAFYTVALHAKYKTKLNPAITAPAQEESD